MKNNPELKLIISLHDSNYATRFTELMLPSLKSKWAPSFKFDMWTPPYLEGKSAAENE